MTSFRSSSRSPGPRAGWLWASALLVALLAGFAAFFVWTRPGPAPDKDTAAEKAPFRRMPNGDLEIRTVAAAIEDSTSLCRETDSVVLLITATPPDGADGIGIAYAVSRKGQETFAAHADKDSSDGRMLWRVPYDSAAITAPAGAAARIVSAVLAYRQDSTSYQVEAGVHWRIRLCHRGHDRHIRMSYPGRGKDTPHANALSDTLGSVLGSLRTSSSRIDRLAREYGARLR